MKKIYLFLLFCTTPFFGQYTLIPDPVFEQNLINQQIDSDGIINGQILSSDIAFRTQLTLSSTNGGLNLITNLQGIEGFIALEKLTLVDNDGGMPSVQINSNPNLKELYFFGNFLGNLIISAPLLQILAIENLSPVLQNLNVTNCPMLKNLYCPNNALTILDVSNNTELEFLTVIGNMLTQLNTTNNNNLVYLNCYNNLLTSLDLSNNTALTHLYTGINNLSSLNVSQNTVLQIFGCGSNNLNSLDVSQNIFLKQFYCSDNNITSLTLQNNIELEYLGCSENNLTELNIQNGANILLNGTITSGQTSYPRFDASNNPNLNCILVNDVANCQANWAVVDPASHFVASQAACDNLLNSQSFSINELEIYPNPVSDILTINIQNFGNLNITIYNLLGEKILDQETNKKEINVSKLPSGIYLVLIVADNKTFTKKIVKN